LGLDWQAIDIAELFASSPTAHALIQRAVAARIDDEWLKEARDYLKAL